MIKKYKITQPVGSQYKYIIDSTTGEVLGAFNRHGIFMTIAEVNASIDSKKIKGWLKELANRE